MEAWMHRELCEALDALSKEIRRLQDIAAQPRILVDGGYIIPHPGPPPKEKGPESSDPEPTCRELDSRCVCFCKD